MAPQQSDPNAPVVKLTTPLVTCPSCGEPVETADLQDHCDGNAQCRAALVAVETVIFDPNQ